jgi:hypothetical protein
MGADAAADDRPGAAAPSEDSAAETESRPGAEPDPGPEPEPEAGPDAGREPESTPAASGGDGDARES